MKGDDNLRKAVKRDAVASRKRRIKDTGLYCKDGQLVPPPKPRRKWTDGGGTGLVDWTGDLGPGLQVDWRKVAKE